MAKKIDPLNKKQYSAVSAMLTVSDIPAAVSFYQKALGFSKRAIMNGPDGKPMHAELTLRGTTLMLGPENAAWGTRSAKSVGASPASLFIYVENVDKVVEKATKLGASSNGPVMDMFWGDRCGKIVDPDGYSWMIGTHKTGAFDEGNEEEDVGADEPARHRHRNRSLRLGRAGDPRLSRLLEGLSGHLNSRKLFKPQHRLAVKRLRSPMD